ncbi:hypothetical protein [Parvibaculum sp.]|uniref:hypothetical protein n=1 Tax=Parvibaculum sp. TaxID=2024848 RepID=UPI00320CE328
MGDLISTLFGGGSEQRKETTQSGPWSEQQPYLKLGFQNAQDLFKSAQGSPFYTGNLYAGMNDQQKRGYGLLSTFGSTQGSGLADAATAAANTSLGVGSAASITATNLANGNFDRGGSTPYDTSAVNTGLDLLSTGARTLGATLGDPTGQNVGTANRYINSDVLNGQIDAIGKDISRNLNENVLPGLNRAASIGGNLNSSRAGAAEAIAKRAAADTLASTAANMRGAAYANGLNLAEQSRQANLDGGLNAVGAGASIADNSLNRSESQRQFNLGTMLGANGQLVEQLGLGFNGANSAMNLGGSAAGMVTDAGTAAQADAQNEMNEQYRKWQGNDQRPWDLLSRYWSIVSPAIQTQQGQSTQSGSTSKGIFQSIPLF